jgi:hypothetical protein
MGMWQTKSLILANSKNLRLKYLPYASNEVMVKSSILANSAEVRAIAMLS